MIFSEGQSVELKASLGLWREIVEASAAFASAQGGKVFVGIRDDGTVIGVTLGKDLLEDLANKIAQNTAPRIVPGITTTTEQGKTDLRKPHESRPRNKLVADAFFLIKYIEQFGTGTHRMINDCREAGMPEPEFESRAGAFHIVFRCVESGRKGFVGATLNERQKKALAHVMGHGRITRSEYETVAATTERTAKRDLNELVKKGTLVKRGGGNNFWYELMRSHSETISPTKEAPGE
jgi:predicted HTH transcriptional regulator